MVYLRRSLQLSRLSLEFQLGVCAALPLKYLFLILFCFSLCLELASGGGYTLEFGSE